MDTPLLKDGNHRIAKAILCDGMQGAIDGREIVCPYHDAVLDKIHLAPDWGRGEDFFREKKADGVCPFGGKFHKNTVGKVKLGKPFKIVGDTVKYTVKTQRTGLRG